MMARKALLFGISLLVIAGLVPALGEETRAQEEARGIFMGAWTQIWPYMWAGGKDSHRTPDLSDMERVRWTQAVANLDRYGADGARWNLVGVRQSERDRFDWLRLERVVAEHRRRGIEVVFRIFVAETVYHELAEERSRDHGYHRGLYSFTRELAGRFAGRVRHYIIENELDHEVRRRPDLTYADYEKVLATAGQAIKDVDPSLLVMNHGPSGYGLGLVQTAELWDAGRREEAIAFYDEYMKDLKHEHWPNTAEELGKWLGKPQTRLQINFVRESLSHFDHYDVYQFHNYQNWTTLERTLNWVEKQMAAADRQLPIMATEIGYRTATKPGTNWRGEPTRWLDRSRYDGEEHARSLVKKLTILASHGVTTIQYWPYRMWRQYQGEESPSVGLYRGADQEFVEGKAIQAYRTFCRLLAGGKYDGPVAAGKGVRAYRFLTDSGPVVIAWTDDGSGGGDLARFGKVSRVTSILGEQLASEDPAATLSARVARRLSAGMPGSRGLSLDSGGPAEGQDKRGLPAYLHLAKD